MAEASHAGGGDLGTNSQPWRHSEGAGMKQGRNHLNPWEVDGKSISWSMVKSRANQMKENRLEIAKEIKQTLFVSPSQISSDLVDLEAASADLEKSLNRIPIGGQSGDKELVRFRWEENHGNFENMGRKLELGREILGQQMGLSHEDVFNHSWRFTQKKKKNHSWRPHQERWIWISKQSALEGVGFPATKAEIRRFGHQVRE